MPDAKSASGLRLGHNGSKAAPMPGMDDVTAKDFKKDGVSLEENNSSVGIGSDEDLGGGPSLTGKKRKDLIGGSADENGPVTKRVLRSDTMKLRAAAETACGVAVEVSKSVSLDRKHCGALMEADGSEVLMADTCSGEDKELVIVNESGVWQESSRRAEDNVEISGVAAMEFVPGNGLGTQGCTADLDDKIIKSDEKILKVTHKNHKGSRAGINRLTVDESQANKVGDVSFQGEVIDPSAVANDDKMSTDSCRINTKCESESDDLVDDAVVHTERVVLHCEDQNVEKHSHLDDVHKETAVSLTETGTCTVNSHNDLTESTKQEGRGIHVNEPKDASTPDIVFTRRKSLTRKSGEAKQIECEEDLRVEKRVTRSATVRQREICGGSCKTIKEETTVGSKERKGKTTAHYTRKVSSSVSPVVHRAELVECNISTKKQTVKEKVADRRSSGVTVDVDHVNKTVNKVSKDEIKINSKSQPPTEFVSLVKKITEAAAPAVDQNISSSAITEKNETEHTNSEGVKSENKARVQKSVGQKIVAGMNSIMKSGLDKIAGRSPVAMPSKKRTRNTSSDTELEQPKRSSREEHNGKNCDLEGRRILRGQKKQTQQAKSCRSSNRSNRNSREQPQDESDNYETGSTSYRKTRSRYRHGADPHAIKKEETSSDSEEVIIAKRTRRKGKDSEQKQIVGSKLRLGRPARAKSESSSLSHPTENEEMKAHQGKGKAPICRSGSSSEQIDAGSLREEKQKISAQIKEILTNAGWKIDLRPRNGRNYMDSVYIPPDGKGSYWSITKAYYMFLEGAESEQKGSVSSPGKRNASSNPGCTLTDNILSKLKRVVVNKRRTKLEIQKLRKKKHVMLRKVKNSKGKLKEKKNKITNSKRLYLGKERKKRSGCALLARGFNKEFENDNDGFVPYEWKRTIFSWLIDLDVLSVNCKLKFMDDSHSKVLLEGKVTRDGIDCSCCAKIIAVHEFVAHAGCEVKNPYRNILVDQLDVDLLHCLNNAWSKQSDSERQAFFPFSTEGDDPNDDTCGICGDGGNLICCDGCPSTFHMSCLGLEALPSDNWCCANCSCKFCHEHSNCDAEDIAGVDSSLRTCSQCEEKYHQACYPEIDPVTSESGQSVNLFCQQSCKLLSEELQSLLSVKKDLGPDYSCRVIQRIHEDVPDTVLPLDTRVECNSKIAIAFSLMDECFRPIVDHRTGINLIHNVVYSCGSNFVRLDFRGFYIFILERGDEIIAAASVRIHGTKLAEMPFIGTRTMYRRQGMCRRLLDGIEMILSSLNVEKLIIPAITELVDTWTSKFGFSPLEDSHKQEVKSISMLVFPGTGLLQKPMLKALPDEHPCSEGDA